MKTDFKTVDEYISSFPSDVQTLLQKVREVIKRNAPDASELISYGMPAYKANRKPLIYFAAYKKHIGLYATPAAQVEFAEELAKYKQGKGSVQFPIDKSIPFDLIKKIVAFRVQQNAAKTK